MKVIIDRFEGDFAVVEIDEGSFSKLPKALVPKGAKEGSVISITAEESDTEARCEETDGLMDKLFM
ncbi:MAG: DUF3006 domain-containing protein [Acutalibacteraceae bacterium]